MLLHKITIVLVLLLLAACAQNSIQPSDTQQEGEINQRPLSEKCKSAKEDFDKAVQEGLRDGLHELKRNIELYCVWRRY